MRENPAPVICILGMIVNWLNNTTCHAGGANLEAAGVTGLFRRKMQRLQADNILRNAAKRCRRISDKPIPVTGGYMTQVCT